MSGLSALPPSIARLLAGSGKQSWAQTRSRRVVLLLSAVLLMSLGDLYMTLTYLLNVGMLEDNPLARAVMLVNRPMLLIGWKLGSLVLGLGILFWARRSRNGEWGAWICFAALGWLMIHWSLYNSQMRELTPAIAEMAQTKDARWVTMTGS